MTSVDSRDRMGALAVAVEAYLAQQIAAGSLQRFSVEKRLKDPAWCAQMLTTLATRQRVVGGAALPDEVFGALIVLEDRKDQDSAQVLAALALQAFYRRFSATARQDADQ